MQIKKNINQILFSLIIPSLITGPFVPNLLIVIISIICMIEIIVEKKFYYFYNRYFICFIVWCFYLIFTSLLSNTPINSLESSLFYFRFGIFGVISFYLLKKNKNLIYYFFYTSFIFLIFVFIDSFYQYFNTYNIFQIYNFYQTNEMRLSGLFRDELILGSYFTRLYPLLVFIIFFLYEKNKKILISLFTLLSLITLIISVISGERAALLYFILALMMIGIIYLKNNFLLILSSLLVIIILISTIILSNNNIKKRIIDKTFDDLNLGNLEKVNIFPKSHSDYYYTSLKMFSNNVMLGIGTKNYRNECKSKIYKKLNACSTHPHQTYFQLLAETGIIGTLPVISILMYFIYSYSLGIIRIYIYNNKENFTKLKNILSISFIITLLPLIPTGNFFSSWLSIIYYLPVGFYFFLTELSNINEKK